MLEMKLSGFLACEREIKLKAQIGLPKATTELPQNHSYALSECGWSLLSSYYSSQPQAGCKLKKRITKMVVLQLSD